MQESTLPTPSAEFIDTSDSWNQERQLDTLRAFIERRLADASLVDVEVDA